MTDDELQYQLNKYEMMHYQSTQRDNLKGKLDQFCKNYDVRVVHENQQHQRYRRIHHEFFTDPYNADIIRDRDRYEQAYVETESLFTISIPESRLRALLEMEERCFHPSAGRHQREMFEILLDKERKEQYFRETNEAVKKAYEQYSMLLHLAGYDEKLP